MRLVVVSLLMIAAASCLVLSFPWLKTPSSHHEIADSISHLRYSLAIVLLAAFVLLLGAALIKLQLEGSQEGKYSAGSMQLRHVLHAAGHEIGIALFVAAVVSLLFEFTVRVAETAQRQEEQREQDAEKEQEREDQRMQRQQDQKELKENVFQAVFGHTIDRDVIKEVVESVFESPLTRHDLDVNCHLYCPDKGKSSLKVQIEFNYHLKNTTSKTVYWGQPPSIGSRERPEIRASFVNLEPGEPNTDSFTAFVASDETLKRTFAISESDLKKARAEAIDDFAKLSQPRQAGAEEKASIHQDQSQSLEGTEEEPKGQSSEKFKDFVYIYRARSQALAITTSLPIEPGRALVISHAYQVTKRRSDSVVVYTPYPTTNYRFTVSKGEGAGDLRVVVGSTHRRQPVRLTPGIQHEGPGETYKYQIPAAVLPGQAIELYWYPWNQDHPSKGATAGKSSGV